MARLKIDLDYLASGKLPHVCIVCGRPAEGVALRRFGVLGRAAIGSPLVSERTRSKVAVPICARHRWHWSFWSTLASVAGLFGFVVWFAVAAVCLSLAPEKGDARVLVGVGGGLFGGMILGITWVAVSISWLATKIVKAVGFQGNAIILANVSDEFAEACTAMPATSEPLS